MTPCSTSPRAQGIYDPERLRCNIQAWAEVTNLCIELRKAILKAKTGIGDDAELTRRVLADIVVLKEKQWTLMQP